MMAYVMAPSLLEGGHCGLVRRCGPIAHPDGSEPNSLESHNSGGPAPIASSTKRRYLGKRAVSVACECRGRGGVACLPPEMARKEGVLGPFPGAERHQEGNG